MIVSLLARGWTMITPLTIAFQNAQIWLDQLLVPAQDMTPDGVPPGEKKSSFPAWAIVIPTWAIVMIGALVVACLIPICIIGLLTLLGPAIGNVFSSTINSEMGP